MIKRQGAVMAGQIACALWGAASSNANARNAVLLLKRMRDENLVYVEHRSYGTVWRAVRDG
jgi:hypothetical protein